jgi:hypothetical protein
LHPWQTTLNASIAVAMKARQAVRVSRLELDAAKQTYVVLFVSKLEERVLTNFLPCLFFFLFCFFLCFCSLKSASPARQEHARLEVENAEDDLVQKTEVAITLMKTVLENVSLFQLNLSHPPTYLTIFFLSFLFFYSGIARLSLSPDLIVSFRITRKKTNCPKHNEMIPIPKNPKL